MNALINGLNYVAGEYIFVLHSDDMLPDKDFKKCIYEMNKDATLDGIFGDFIVIDDKSKIKGMQIVPRYEVCEGIIALMLLWLG